MRIDAYLPVMVCGIASAVVWHCFDPQAKPASVKQIQDTAEELVLRLLAPEGSSES